jgi:hypothetical protein
VSVNFSAMPAPQAARSNDRPIGGAPLRVQTRDLGASERRLHSCLPQGQARREDNCWIPKVCWDFPEAER